MKLDSEVFCPKTLALPNGAAYLLNSVINHIGESATSGHYNIMIFDEPNEEFILLDDSVILHNVKIDMTMAKTSYVAAYTRI